LAQALARLAVSLYYWPGTAARRAALAEEAVRTARRLDDPKTLIHVLSNAQLAVWGPDTTERDLAWVEEARRLMDEAGDHELELSLRNRQVDFLVELDDLPAAAGALRALELTITAGSDPSTPGYMGLHRARQAMIEGRYADAESMNAKAREVGSRLHDRTLEVLAMTQLVSLYWAQGRLDELEQGTRRIAEGDSTPARQAALALVCWGAGHEDEARRRFERIMLHDLPTTSRYTPG
jgi:hypothetical protein